LLVLGKMGVCIVGCALHASFMLKRVCYSYFCRCPIDAREHVSRLYNMVMVTRDLGIAHKGLGDIRNQSPASEVIIVCSCTQ
jgi:hypothetical protein